MYLNRKNREFIFLLIIKKNMQINSKTKNLIIKTQRKNICLNKFIKYLFALNYHFVFYSEVKYVSI